MFLTKAPMEDKLQRLTDNHFSLPPLSDAHSNGQKKMSVMKYGELAGVNRALVSSASP